MTDTSSPNVGEWDSERYCEKIGFLLARWYNLLYSTWCIGGKDFIFIELASGKAGAIEHKIIHTKTSAHVAP
jgi:hypothetical protein